MRNIKGAAVFAAAVLAVGGALPAGAAVAPATFSLQFIGIPNSTDVTSNSPLSATYIYQGGTLDVYASAAATARPAAGVGIASGGCTSGYPGSGCAGGAYIAIADIFYEIEVRGPADRMVPYFFQSAGGITAVSFDGSGVFPFGYASVSLLGAGGFEASSILTGTGESFCGTTCINSTNLAFLMSNTTYTIRISAQASASTNFKQTVNVWADPYIYIDPTFDGGDQFSLLISDGIGNEPFVVIPIPGALPLFASGLGLFGWVARRRKVRAAAA